MIEPPQTWADAFDSWTRDELHALAWAAGQSIGWDDMDQYDDPAVLS